MRPAPMMTQIEMKQRRKILAQLVSTGQSCQAVADKFDCSDTTVRNACREFGVDIKFRSRGKSM
jgi:transposase